MKKVVLVGMLLVLASAVAFSDTVGMLQVSGTIASNLSLTLNSAAYTLLAGGATKASISAMTVKSNAKTSFTLAVETANAAVNNSFVAKATVAGSAAGAVTNWPYRLFLDDDGVNVELTPGAPSKTFTRKTKAAGDVFTLQTTYDSAESLNLDAGVYSDTITVKLTAL